jgi:predicted outer membrane repeat protein
MGVNEFEGNSADVSGGSIASVNVDIVDAGDTILIDNVDSFGSVSTV